MRLLSLAAVVAVIFSCLAFTPDDAAAFGWKRQGAPAGYARVQPIKRWVYRPRYRVNSHEDPYRYRYEPRGYYPYYNSGYWRPRNKVRRNYRFRHPPYYRAWGDNRRHYKHREWHRRNHGRIPFWQW